jgi:hypothetical protein
VAASTRARPGSSGGGPEAIEPCRRLQANAGNIRQVFQGMAPELQAITAAAVLGNNNKQADKKTGR